MNKTVRGTLLIIAAVLGVTQLWNVYKWFDLAIFTGSLASFPEKAAIALLVPAAICGVLAASLIVNTNLSRLFAALAAGFKLLSVLIQVVYFAQLYASTYDLQLSEIAKVSFTNLRYFLGFSTFDEFVTSNWILLLGTFALILWIVCAAFPAGKGSVIANGADSAGIPNSFPSNSTPVNLVPSYAPAPVNTATASPTAGQGSKFCTNCGKPLVGVAKFCAECGTPV